MPRFVWKMFSLAVILPTAAPALAGEGAVKPAAVSKAWKPKWRAMKGPSENTHLVNTTAQRLFSPLAAVRITNHLRDDGAEAKEVLLGGHENNVATIKLYQESTDRYTRVDIPPEMMRDSVRLSNGTTQTVELGLQGMGTAGKNLVVAGGSSASHNNGYGATAKVFMVDAQTKKVKALPDLKKARALPMVGASPNGRYVVVAGGVETDPRGNGSSSKAIDVIDRVTGQHVDLTKQFHGLAEGLPDGRFGGSVVWVQEKGLDRIFFIGGTSVPALAQTSGGLLAQQPTKTIHYYDVMSRDWGTMELPTPRMGAAVAVRHLGDGHQEIVVAGGGTGVNATRRVDPQIYAVERIDPRFGTVKFGESLPEQQGLYVNKNNGNSNASAIEWTPNAMVLTHGKAKTKAERRTDGARFFGFSNAYTTEPGAHEAHEGGLKIENTTINQTNITENVRVDERSVQIEAK